MRYADDDDPDHVMSVALPEGDGPFPALILIHGGSWQSGSRFVDEYYARRGIATFSIDYQLSTPETPSWPASIQDVVCSVRHIKENASRYRIDPDRVAAMGWSAGGHLASLLGTLDGDEPFLAEACGNSDVSSRVILVVDYFGPTNLEWVGVRAPEVLEIVQFLGDNYTENPALWLSASPHYYIGNDDPVFVIAHGTEDTVVPFAISISFADQLEAAGVETHLVLREGAGHGFDDDGSQQVRRVMEPVMRRLLQP